MVTILLEKILTLFTGWLDAFTEHSTNVLAKLNLIEEDTSNLSDIKDNTADTASNTASVITPINNISSNTSSIKTNTDSIKADTTIIKNNINTISTNTGSTSAYCQNIANNTLECSNRLVTIGSDTTQLRSNSNNITADVSEIKTALNYYIGNTLVTEDSEGSICNFDTDLEDYLQKSIVTIPTDLTGFSGITLTKCGKNLLNASVSEINTTTPASATTQPLNIPFTIVFSMTASSDYANSDNYWLIYIQKADNSRTYITPIAGQTKTQIITADSNNPITAIYYRKTGVTSGSVTNFMIEKGNVATTYEPYKAITYPVSFGSTITDGAEIDLLNGVMKINTTPVSYSSITPIVIRTYKGTNNIYSDIGNMSVTYRETLKHYLDKQ